MKLTDLTQRADALISLGEYSLTRTRQGAYGSPVVESDAFTEFRSSVLSFIDRVFGRSHPYFEEFSAKVSDVSDYEIKYGLGILRAIKAELSGGWLTTTRGLVSGEVFADFLEMGEHLLEEQYKDPAAVMIGSVLEEHLRQLAGKCGVPTTQSNGGRSVPRKADALNADLAKANAYGVLDQKLITGWLDLRNKAAHGKYSDYTIDQVRLMLGGVQNFLVRVPV